MSNKEVSYSLDHPLLALCPPPPAPVEDCLREPGPGKAPCAGFAPLLRKCFPADDQFGFTISKFLMASLALFFYDWANTHDPYLSLSH